jgi:bacterioferritin-associated ferredoxin
MAKTIVCRCEDVTLNDLEKAFGQGFRDLESLKRYTGFATGFCQGKSCTAHAARYLAAMKGGDDVVSDPPRTRPLLHPTAAAAFLGPENQPAGTADAQPSDGSGTRGEEPS